jgi:hypothetical protein
MRHSCTPAFRSDNADPLRCPVDSRTVYTVRSCVRWPSCTHAAPTVGWAITQPPGSRVPAVLQHPQWAARSRIGARTGALKAHLVKQSGGGLETFAAPAGTDTVNSYGAES